MTDGQTTAQIIKFQPPKKEPESHPIFSCSFVRKVPIPGRKRAKQWCFWCVEPSDDYFEDYQRGEDMALEFIEAHGKVQWIGVFGASVFDDMAKADPAAHRGLTAGFMNMLARITQAAYSPEWFAALRQHEAQRRGEDAKKWAEFVKQCRERKSRRKAQPLRTA